jgi:sugar/nucleoside kinase (ribokinase family)
MTDFDVVVVGHVSIDVNILPWGVIENALGGAPTYAGFALAALKKNTGIVAKVGADFPDRFPPLYSKFGLDTEGILIAGESTTTFENTYDEAGNRKQACTRVAPKISPDDIPYSYQNASSFYVSPIVDEITPDVLKAIKKNTNLVMLDPQGIFREIGVSGEVKLKAREDLGEFLKYVDIVKVGKDEAGVIGGDTKELLRKLAELGPKVAILTQGEKGCLMLADGKSSEVATLKVDAKDLTGAGDVFGAAFLVKYLESRDAIEAARFANAAAALKIRYKGPTGFPSEKEISEAISKSSL